VSPLAADCSRITGESEVILLACAVGYSEK